MMLADDHCNQIKETIASLQRQVNILREQGGFEKDVAACEKTIATLTELLLITHS
jgi:hypothetical protein